MKLISFLVAAIIFCLSTYFGFWVLIIGGIVDLINEFKSDLTNQRNAFIALIKICAGQFVVWIGYSLSLCFSLGSKFIISLFTKSDK